MMKRKLEDAEDAQKYKKVRKGFPDRISCLSDELVLRILSWLPTPTLTLCERYVTSILVSATLFHRLSAHKLDSLTGFALLQATLNCGRRRTTTDL